MAERPGGQRLTPRFGWNARARRYVELRSGQFVPQQAVADALDTVIQRASQNMRGLSVQLQGGQISLVEWQQGMAANVKLIHTASAATAAGGWAQMRPADWGWVGQRLRAQYSFLRNFALDVATGKQQLDGRFLRRAEMYAEAGRGTHRELDRRLAHEAGQDEERNILGAADHCNGCLDATRRGWVPIGTLPAVGARDCLTRCHCTLEYRTAEEAAADDAA